MNSEYLVWLLAIVVALLFDWFPGIAKWFNPKPEGTKRLLVGGLLLVICLAIFSLECADIYSIGVICSVVGAKALAILFVQALLINYGFHKVTKPSAIIKARLF